MSRATSNRIASSDGDTAALGAERLFLAKADAALPFGAPALRHTLIDPLPIQRVPEAGSPPKHSRRASGRRAAAPPSGPAMPTARSGPRCRSHHRSRPRRRQQSKSRGRPRRPLRRAAGRRRQPLDLIVDQPPQRIRQAVVEPVKPPRGASGRRPRPARRVAPSRRPSRQRKGIALGAVEDERGQCVDRQRRRTAEPKGADSGRRRPHSAAAVALDRLAALRQPQREAVQRCRCRT